MGLVNHNAAAIWLLAAQTRQFGARPTYVFPDDYEPNMFEVSGGRDDSAEIEDHAQD